MNPRARQLFVATSTFLAALSVGASVGFPTVLLQQFKDNDSSFQIDADTSSWIGSIQGMAGIPSIFMPTVMQIKGRKVAFFISCLILAFGWITIFFARNVITIIIGQFFLGLGNNSLTTLAYSTLSEMIEPQLRSISMIFNEFFICVGISAVHALGRSFSWTYVDAIMFVPILISGVMTLFWMESPAWLAYKGEFEKCKMSFSLLRGTSERAAKELCELINKEICDETTIERESLTEKIKGFCKTLLRRDCYLPCLHTIITLSLMYWGGSIVIFVYSGEMLEGTTSNKNAISVGLVIVDFVVIAGSLVTWLLLIYFANKIIIVATGVGIAVCLILTCIFNYLQILGYLPKDSLLGFCSLLGFIISSNIGVAHLSFTLPAELMPVKHKSIGGALYIVCCAVLHFSVLKWFPYMMNFFGLLGTLICFNVVTVLCLIYIWKFVPETRHKTLQEIEMCYNKNVDNHNISESVVLTEPANSVYQSTVYKFS